MNVSPCCKADFVWVDGDGVEYEVFSCEKCDKEFHIDIEVKRYWESIRELK
tara:strand:- start:81 stop:233 length:153 start_codon:yes stop_codon:yes gene_type:complete